MNIRFRGLVVHARLDNGTQVAVLAQHDTHRAFLTVPEGSLRSTTADYKHENGVYCFALRGHLATLKSGASKTAGIGDLPSILDMRNGGGDVHSGIIRREHHPDLFHSLFEIPRGGTLISEDHFWHKGMHKFKIGCVGRTVLYSLDTDEDVEFTLRHDAHKKIVIKSDADHVYVTNRCAVENNSGESDQAAYAKIFFPRADSITPVKSDDTQCPKGSTERGFKTCGGVYTLKRENIDVDCTSSRYP